MLNQEELFICLCLMDNKPTPNIYFTEGGIILCDICYRIHKDLPLSMTKDATALRLAGCTYFDVMAVLDGYREHFKNELDFANHFLFVPNIRAVKEAIQQVSE